MHIYVFITFIFSFFIGMIFIPVVLRFCKKKQIYDIPDARKVHKTAIPRLGGVAFLPSAFFGTIMAILILRIHGSTTISLSMWTVYFFIGMMVIYITGLLDDLFGLQPLTKLMVQLAAASMLPLSGLYINSLNGFAGIYEITPLIGMPLTIIIVAFISNAINLVDGIDGLSGSLSIISLMGFLYAFSNWELWTYSIIIAGLIGVIVAFLYFNMFGTPENGNKIFMGDTGSLSLGYLLAFLSLKISTINPDTFVTYDGNGLLLSFTLLLIPTLDVFRVAMLRIRNKRSPVAPDKNHIHHKLMRIGMSQRQTLYTILIFEVLFILLNASLVNFIGFTHIVIIDITIYVIFHLLIDYILMRRGKPTTSF